MNNDTPPDTGLNHPEDPGARRTAMSRQQLEDRYNEWIKWVDANMSLFSITPFEGEKGVRFIFLNGPPSVGKDTVGAAIERLYHIPRALIPTSCIKFAAILKEKTHEFFGLYDSTGRVLPHDHYELVKNMPMKQFRGMSPRAAYIWLSEKVMKPQFGDAIFGELLAEKVLKQSPFLKSTKRRAFVVTDSGFFFEALAFRDAMEAHGVKATYHLIRLYRDGTTFDGDSRSYLRAEAFEPWPFDTTDDITNDSTPEAVAKRIITSVHRER